MFVFEVLLSFNLEISLSNNWRVFSFEVPNLISNFSSNSNPMASRIESKAVNRWSCIMTWGWFFYVRKIKNSNFFIFSSSYNKVSSWWDSDGIDTSVMNLNTILNIEGLVIPDLKISVPSDRWKELSSNWSLCWSRDESNLRNPIAMVVLFNSVFAVTFNVPKFDLSISSWRKDVSSVRGNGTWKNFFSMAVFSESLSGLSSSEIPESERSIPWRWKEIIVIIGQGKITNEVRMSS